MESKGNITNKHIKSIRKIRESQNRLLDERKYKERNVLIPSIFAIVVRISETTISITISTRIITYE